MAEVVGGIAISHSSMMVSQPDSIAPEMWQRCSAALGTAGQRLAALAPDVLVMIGADHFNTFTYDLVPATCISLAERHQGWADNLPYREVPGDPEFALDLAGELIHCGTGTAYSHTMKIDHSFVGPLTFLTPDLSTPVVPIFQNSIYAPLPSPRASYEFGVALGASIAAASSDRRVAVIASGGLSHWIGGPEHGRVSSEFDREFLARLGSGDIEWLTALTEDDLQQRAGNGGQEVRNWLTLLGALPGASTEIIYYEAIPEWIVGCAIAALTPAGASS